MMIMILIHSLTATIAVNKDFHENFKLRLLASFSCNRVSFIFDVFVDLFDKQIERHMLKIRLSRGSQLHRHTEAIGVVVKMRKVVFDEIIELGADVLGRRAQKVRVSSRVQGWCASKVRWCVGSGCLSECVENILPCILIYRKGFSLKIGSHYT